MRLSDKVAVITGAGSGIGYAIAKLFVEEGAQVVASDIKSEGLAALSQDVQHASERLTTTITNVAERESAEQLCELAVQTYGHLDIAINNAGIMDDFMPLAELEDSLWRRVMSVNLDGPMYVARKALQLMLPQGKGVIVNIASVGGLFGGRSGVAYTTSKHAVIGLTRSVAYQYAKQGIRCNAICPGGVATNISVQNPSRLGYQRLETTLQMAVRTADPKELAATALFLASDEASFINGAILVADGGWTVG